MGFKNRTYGTDGTDGNCGLLCGGKTGMKKGWEIKRLGEVLEKTETTDPTKNPDKEFIYIDVSSVNKENLSIESTTLMKGKDAPSRARKLIKTNDVIFATVRPTLRRIAIIPKEYDGQVCSTGYFVLRAKKHLDNRLVFYFLLTNNFNERMEKLQKGASYPAVTDGDVREQIIAYPKTLPEQKRIVGILDKAFAAISTAKANAQKNLANARELFESYLQGVFANPGDGWEEKKLGVVSKITDGTHFSPKNTSEGKYMYITAKNIKRYYIDLTKISYITEKDHMEIYKRCPVKKGDVLYIKDGATAGIATLNTIEEEFSLLSSVAVFKPYDCLLNTYLVHYMNSEIGRKNFLGYIDGAAITRLTLIKLKNVTIPLPPLPEQKHIVAKLDAISVETRKLEAIYRQKVADLEELKKSVLQRVFEGEI